MNFFIETPSGGRLPTNSLEETASSESFDLPFSFPAVQKPFLGLDIRMSCRFSSLLSSKDKQIKLFNQYNLKVILQQHLHYLDVSSTSGAMYTFHRVYVCNQTILENLPSLKDLGVGDLGAEPKPALPVLDVRPSFINLSIVLAEVML